MGSICGRNGLNKLVRQYSTKSSKNSMLRLMKKDPDLELTLSRDKRWTMNLLIRNIILRCPSEGVPVEWMERKFKNLGRLGRAMAWLKKYPSCYNLYLKDGKYYCRLAKGLMSLVEEEKAVEEMQEPVFVDRLAKLLMMTCNHRLKVGKISALRDFGYSEDFVRRVVPKYPDLFKIVNDTGMYSFTEIVLASWRPDLAVSAIEKVAQREGRDPCFSCKMPSNWFKKWQRFDEFNSTPYVSPYKGPKGFLERAIGSDKRTVGIVHEFLSLTLWGKASINKLRMFTYDLGLSYDLLGCLSKYPGIFYVSNKYDKYTVVLREAYDRSELIDKDPLVVVKEKSGELMLLGRHEYNKKLQNLKQWGKRRRVSLRPGEKMNRRNNDSVKPLVGIQDPEERKRFYKILLE